MLKFNFFGLFFFGLIVSIHAQDLNFKAKAGIRSNSFSVDRKALNRELDFGSLISFSFGAESEVILSSSKNGAWSILLEAMYHSFSSSKTTNLNANNGNEQTDVKLDYKSLEISIGPRYYVSLNKSSKMFFNVLVVLDSNGKSKFDFENSPTDPEFESGLVISAGTGFSFKDKVYLGLRYGFNRNLGLTGEKYIAPYSNVSLMLAYSIF